MGGEKRHERGVYIKLAVIDDREIFQDKWILDSGLSRHLVNDERILENSRTCNSECTLPDGQSLHVTMVRSVLLHVTVAGNLTVRLTDVHLAPRITRNFILCGELEQRGVKLGYVDGVRSLVYPRLVRWGSM